MPPMTSRKTARKSIIPRGTTPFGRIMEHISWLASGKGVAAILSLIYIAIATRTLGPANFGRFILITGAATAISQIVAFNVWQVIVKHGQAYIAPRDPAGMGRLVALCAFTDLGAAIAGCIVSAVVCFLFDEAMGLPGELSVQAFAFAAITMLTIRSTPIGILRLLAKFDTAAISETILPVFRMIGALAVLATGPSIPAFLLAWGVAEVACAIAYWWYARRAVREEFGSLDFSGWWRRRGEVPGLGGFMLITNFSYTLASLALQLPVLLVGAVVGPVGAGFYRLGHQLGQSFSKISNLFSRTLYSELAHVHVHHGRAELRALFRRTSMITLGAAAACAVVILIAGKPILLAMSGPAYAGAYPLVAVLGVAAAINLAGVGFEPLLLATDAAGSSLRLRFITIVVLFGAMAALLPAYGAIGAAWSVLISAVVNFLLMGFATWRQLRG
jgi:O-antigen/teichoic acid export membrane protein